jgi:UDP-glucose 4-epimerase
MRRGSFLVTGGAGFIGSNLAATLALAGERVRAYDNLFTGHWALLDRLLGGRADVERITADIRDGEALARAMEGVEVVFHEAADGSVPRSVADPLACDSINVHGTVAVLEAARRAGVKRLIFAASSAAYGDEPTLPKRESMATCPMSPYAVSKVAGEQYLRAYAGLYGLETVSLRYFNVFGPNQLPTGAYAAAIPRFAHAALTGEPPTVYGDGEQTRDFCFIDNVVAANLAAASSSRKFSGEIINIAGGRVVSLNGVIAELGRLLGRPVAARHEAPRAGDIRHSYADISLAGELLGYRPTTPWEAGLAPTVDFLRELVERGLPGLARPLQP